MHDLLGAQVLHNENKLRRVEACIVDEQTASLRAHMHTDTRRKREAVAVEDVRTMPQRKLQPDDNSGHIDLCIETAWLPPQSTEHFWRCMHYLRWQCMASKGPSAPDACMRSIL